MSKPTIAIYVLLALLIGSNAIWLQRAKNEIAPSIEPIEMHCTRTEESAEIYNSIVLPLTDAITAAAQSGASKESILQSANSAGSGTTLICIEDPAVVQVRGVGLRFNDNGQLTGATVAHCMP